VVSSRSQQSAHHIIVIVNEQHYVNLHGAIDDFVEFSMLSAVLNIHCSLYW